MKLSQLGEFKLIEQLKRAIPRSAGVITGIGDDAAVVKINPRRDGLLTTDALIEGVHFRKADDPIHIGMKAISCSLSDIAAMGGVAKYALVSLGVRPTESVARVKKVYQGMIRRAKEYGTGIVGGDIVKSRELILNVALYGEVAKGRAFTRSGANVGDRIYVSGPLGNSLKSGHHLTFKPRLKEAAYLRRHLKISAMIDISDGLVADLGHICRLGKVGARLEAGRIPLRGGARLDNALYDGEDFELLFTVSKKEAEKLERLRQRWTRCIGEITGTKKIELIRGHIIKTIDRNKGFRHF